MAKKKATERKSKRNKSKSYNIPYLLLFVALSIFALDFFTKSYIHKHIPVMDRDALWYPYYGIGVFENFLGIEFSITHATNLGAAWGILSNYQVPLLVFRVIMVAGLINFLIFFNKNKKFTIPLLMIAVGALGNIVDYYLYGHVIDMFNFVFWGYHYPVFNIADSAIFIGIIWAFWISISEKQ